MSENAAQSLQSKIEALGALKGRLSPHSFATDTVTRLHSAAGALADIVTSVGKTGDAPERKAQRVSDAADRYLESVNRAAADLDARELGGLANLSQQFAERVGLSTDRWAANIVDAFRNANQTDRTSMLTQIVEHGDGRSLAALLEAPQFVHGVDANMIEDFRRAMEEKHAPDVAQKREQFQHDLQAARGALSVAEDLAQSALKVENVSDALAGAEAARQAEQRLADATAE